MPSSTAIAADMHIVTPQETLDLLAERWAILRGGRSPRRARQFAEYVYACEQKGRSRGGLIEQTP